MNYILLGGGGHAKVLADVLKLQSCAVIGFTDKREMAGKEIQGIAWMGDDSAIQKYSADAVLLVNGVGSTGRPILRKGLFERFKELGYTFTTVIHPSAVIAKDVSIAEGGQIMAGAVIQPGSMIGKNTIVNTRASVDHDCSVGEHVHIAPGATLGGGVQVGDSVHIGSGATVIQGIKIGENSVIGAGAVVIRDVPENVTVFGVPARIQRR